MAPTEPRIHVTRVEYPGPTGDTRIITSDGRSYYVRAGEALPPGVDPMPGKFGTLKPVKP